MKFSRFQKLFPYHFNTFLVAVMLVISIPAFSQNLHRMEVRDENNNGLKYPWAGGLNSIQFGEIDIDLDGQMDLFVFDRNGNRKMCFINRGIANESDYEYSPEFVDLFPALSDWAIFADYDGDGKVDIFAYSPGWAGMKVYRNISENLLKFELVVYPFLETFQENGFVNLLVTDVDYPGISDLDGDGDLDILTFWTLGSFVTYHRNMSIEKYGHADSLDYRLEEYCWGKFAESEESNEIYLDTCFLERQLISELSDKERHKGSTFLLLDLDKDSVKDLLLGDVDYPELYALENGGTKTDAYITDVDTTYPQSSEEVRLFNFPACAYIDINNDGLQDLLLSPFDPRLETSENKRSVWMYQNSGENDKPLFTLKNKTFLQSEMIDRGSGAYPVLYDWDGDGLLDLFIGNYGYYISSYYHPFGLSSIYRSRIGYYKNIGTAQNPGFQLWDDDFAELSKLEKVAYIPGFADLDGDGQTDLLVGDSLGNLIYVKNLGDDEFEIVSETYQNINDGFFSAPQLIDLNKDDLVDLVIGEQNGNINYYENKGTAENPDFVFVTDSLGKINVTDYATSWYGYSVPSFFRMANDQTQLVVGSESGKVFYYTNIDDNLDGSFDESDNLDMLLDTAGVNYDRGIRTGAVVGDISKDGKTEMIVGNYSGGLEYFNGRAPVMPGNTLWNELQKITIYPNPASEYLYLSNLPKQEILQLSVTDLNGRLVYQQENINTRNSSFMIHTSEFKNGVYFLRIEYTHGIITKKLLVHH